MCAQRYAPELGISTHALHEEGDLEAHGCGWLTTQISTHALHEEGDSYTPGTLLLSSNFYPRPPRGGRHGRGRWQPLHILISTHALHEEGDQVSHNGPGFL